MAELLSLAVRTLHLLGMVVLLGGAGALWFASTGDGGDVHGSVATRYEWAFWGVLGVLVVTGVGNLGALGAPGPDTRWGTVFLVKLVLVVGLVLGSVVRTLAVALAAADRPPAGLFRRAYGATTLTVTGIVVLAEVLAHG